MPNHTWPARQAPERFVAVHTNVTHAPRPFLVQWVILGVFLALLAGVVVSTLSHSRRSAWNTEAERLLTQTLVVERIVGSNLRKLNTVLVSLSEECSLPQGGRDVNEHLASLIEGLSGVRTLLVLDAKGVIRAASRPQLLGRDFSFRDYFTVVRQRSDPTTLYLTPPFLGELGVFVLTVGRMMSGPNGECAGVVVASLDPEYFIPLLRSVLYAPDMWTSVAHGEGTLFLMEPERPGAAGMNLAAPGSFFSQHLASGRDANVFSGTVYATGEDRLIAVRTIRPAELNMSTSLVVGAARDRDAILADWWREALTLVTLFVLIMGVSVTGLAFYQHRQKAFEREASEVEARNQLLLNALSEGVYGVDADGLITFMNPAALRMLGYDDLGEVLGQNSHALVHHTRPDGTPYPMEDCPLHQAKLLGASVRGVTEVFWRKDGTCFDVFYSGAPLRRDEIHIGAVVTFMDISEQKRAEERLRITTDRLQLATAAAKVGIFDFDIVNNVLVWDDAMYALYGVSPDQFSGAFEAWESVVHPDDIDEARSALERAWGGQEEFTPEFRIVWPSDGSVHSIKANALVQHDASGKAVRMLGTNWDVTESREAAEALREAHDMLERRVLERTAELTRAMEDLRLARDAAESANRMKTDFLVNVSHEFRTPLSGVLGMSQLLAETSLDAEQTDYLKSLSESAKRLHAMIDDLLAVTRLETHTLEPEPTGLQSILEVFRHTFTPLAQAKGLDLRVEAAEGSPSVIVTDPRLVRLILDKLGENAIKFTASGSVELRVSFQNKEGNRGVLCLELTDTGVGIARDKVGVVLSGFAQGDVPLRRRFGGLGLGLEAVRKALALLGGTLGVASEPGEGTRFLVRVPVGLDDTT